ncbi:MAG TPA: hypothetical protein VLU25_03200 [Acidobacteriota bacterium]|nr:hypothetical protein [Acidobacteriota bacterium]
MSVTCRRLKGFQDFQLCYALQEEVWGEGFSGCVKPVMQMIVDKMGGVVSGAFEEDGSLAGFVLGLTGLYRGRLAHWSHMLAVHPSRGGSGVGRSLKWHQRECVMKLGIEEVFWTYDPLESRNAHLNLNLLGARVEEYQRDFYPGSESPRHGHGTDRFLVCWRLSEERVCRLARGQPVARPSADDAVRVEPAHGSVDKQGVPQAGEWSGAKRLRVVIPAEIEAVKSQSAQAGKAWRLFTRAALEHYLSSGYQVVAYFPPAAAGDPQTRWGSYLLQQTQGER